MSSTRLKISLKYSPSLVHGVSGPHLVQDTGKSVPLWNHMEIESFLFGIWVNYSPSLVHGVSGMPIDQFGFKK